MRVIGLLIYIAMYSLGIPFCISQYSPKIINVNGEIRDDQNGQKRIKMKTMTSYALCRL